MSSIGSESPSPTAGKRSSVKGVEMNELIDEDGLWHPKGGTLFVHSHIYDPVGSTVQSGFEDILSAEAEAAVDDLRAVTREISWSASGDTVEAVFRKNPGLYGRLAKHLGSISDEMSVD